MRTVYAVVTIALGVALVGSLAWLTAITAARAHEGTPTHNTSQKFESHYDSTHKVYCAWRHSYEGISCVNVSE